MGTERPTDGDIVVYGFGSLLVDSDFVADEKEGFCYGLRTDERGCDWEATFVARYKEGRNCYDIWRRKRYANRKLHLSNLDRAFPRIIKLQLSFLMPV